MVIHILLRHGHYVSHRALCNSPERLCPSLTSAYPTATDISLPYWSPISSHFFVTEKLLPWHGEWKKTGDNLGKGKRREKRECGITKTGKEETRKQLTMEYFKASEVRGGESNSQEQGRNHICSKVHHLTTPHLLSNATFFLLLFSVSSARFAHCNSSFIHLHVA